MTREAGPHSVWARFPTTMRQRGRHSPGRHIAEEGLTTRLRMVSSMLPVVLVALALLVVAVPKASGYEWRTVVTGSMRPALEPGDVVLISPISERVEVGDVVAFPDPTQLNRDILHRVAAITESGALVTKGDANDILDPWQIDSTQVIGTQTLALPKLGFLVAAVSSKPGIILVLVLPALLILVNEGRVWYQFVRYGPSAFETPNPGRHIPRRGRHLAEVPT
jgi:signal peptidase I